MNDEWKSKRYRYQITLRSGQVVTTDYFDTYQDLENFIRTGAAGFYTPKGFVEAPIAQIQAVQPIDEGQMGTPPQPQASAGDQPPQPPQTPTPPQYQPPTTPSEPPAPPQQPGSVVGPSQAAQEQPTEGELPL